MYELTDLQTESAAGGDVFSAALSIFRFAVAASQTFYSGMGYVGGTLNNYYGPDMTLDIIAAGNMGA